MARSSLTLADIGEDGTLAELLRGFAGPTRLVVGPGDDCAGVRVRGVKELLLLKTDCVVEGIHYDADAPPAAVGRKALCRALSDIAAMGGRPGEALASIFCDPQDSLAYWKAVYRGLRSAARRYGVALVGGEMSRGGQRAISISLTGWVEPRGMVTRDGGRPGDLLYVTGRLGGSLAGHHLAFQPRLAEGRWLGCGRFATAMMDLSDGLAADLPRLAHASRCGWELEEDLLPCTRGSGTDAALNDGEDYELLLAVRPTRAAIMERAWKAAFPRLPLTRIGRLTGKRARPSAGGFDHFRGSPGRPRPGHSVGS